jgi:hemerythrin
VQAVFGQLAEYVRLHFSDEERVMVDIGLASGAAATHVDPHRHFVE